MTRAVPLSLILLALAPAAARGDERTDLGVKVSDCRTAVERVDRSATFTGSMPAVAGAKTMTMRFALYERADEGKRFRRVPGTGGVERAQPNQAGFVFAKTFAGLDVPKQYRVTVRFTWLDADGRVVRRGTRRSALCKQPDLRPDLRIVGLRIADVGDGQAEYVVLVRNAGRSAVKLAFDVALSIDGVLTGRQTLPSLSVLGVRTLVFRAPRCAAGTSIEALAEPDPTVPERDASDNRRAVVCA